MSHMQLVGRRLDICDTGLTPEGMKPGPKRHIAESVHVKLQGRLIKTNRNQFWEGLGGGEYWLGRNRNF